MFFNILIFKSTYTQNRSLSSKNTNYHTRHYLSRFHHICSSAILSQTRVRLFLLCITDPTNYCRDKGRCTSAAYCNGSGWLPQIKRVWRKIIQLSSLLHYIDINLHVFDECILSLIHVRFSLMTRMNSPREKRPIISTAPLHDKYLVSFLRYSPFCTSGLDHYHQPWLNSIPGLFLPSTNQQSAKIYPFTLIS